MSGFARFHPAACCIWFACVLALTMGTLHPVLLAASLLGAVLFYACLVPPKQLAGELSFYAGLFLLISLTNPLFVHSGKTPLFFLNGNPVTREALFYGLALGAMLVAALLWFKCLRLIIGGDKLSYLFGRPAPRLSLLLTLALRFIPSLKAQAARIRAAQKTLGLYSGGGVVNGLRADARVFSALVGWALENAVENADAMRARGYGLPRRSHYAHYPFRRRDAALTAAALALFLPLVAAILTGRLRQSFYPALAPLQTGPLCLLLYGAALALCLLPCILEGEENLRWRILRSSI